MPNEKSNYIVDEQGEITDDQSILEYINELESEMYTTAKGFIKAIRKGQWPTPDQMEKQKQLNKQIAIITQTYNRLVKRKFLKEGVDTDFAELLKKVKEQKSSVGDIVRKID